MSQGVPYLGSKISLISKSEIRYEGILYTIDTNESTVALAKVRSFGTENRPTDRPVAPRDEVYEYIIFRGSDIKDIRVCEPPKPQATLTGGLPNDPAIVQHSTSSGYQGASSYGPIGSSLPTQSFGSSGPFGSDIPAHQSLGSSRSSTPALSRKSPTIDAGVQVSREQSRSQNITYSSTTRGNNATFQRRGGQGERGGGQRNYTDYSNRAENRGQNFDYQSRGGQQDYHQRGYNKMRPNRRPRGGRGMFSRGGQVKPLKFDGEYDFETANTEFETLINDMNKVKIKADDKEKKEDSGNETSEGVEQPEEVITDEAKDDKVYYDKAKSFFDSISCEAEERNKGQLKRTDWRQERKLNVETFGVRGGGYFRGRGRGYRGYGFNNRGGYRGGYRQHQHHGGGDNRQQWQRRDGQHTEQQQ